MFFILSLHNIIQSTDIYLQTVKKYTNHNPHLIKKKLFTDINHCPLLTHEVLQCYFDLQQVEEHGLVELEYLII